LNTVTADAATWPRRQSSPKSPRPAAFAREGPLVEHLRSQLGLVQNERLNKKREDVKAEVSKFSSQATEPGVYSIDEVSKRTMNSCRPGTTLRDYISHTLVDV